MAQKATTKKQPAKADAPKKATVAAKVRSRTQKTTSGFMDFVREQGVVGLAVGLVLGTQVKLVVDQLVKSFIDPLLGLLAGSGKGLASKTFTLTIDGKEAAFGWGAFAYVMIDFLLVALVVYLIVKVLKMDKLDKKKD